MYVEACTGLGSTGIFYKLLEEIYEGSTARFSVDHHDGEPIPIRHGVRQGDVL